MTRCLRILTLLVLLAAAALPLGAQDTRAQEEKIARLQKEIELLSNQLKDNASRSSNALSELTLIRKQIQGRQALIAESDKKISAIRRTIADKQREIDRIQDRLDTLSHYYGKLVHNAYKNRDTRVWYMYILASDNVAQAFRRFSYLKNLSREMNGQAEKIAAVKLELEAQTAQLNEMKKEAEAIRAQRQQDVAQLRSEEARSQQIIAQLNKDKKGYQRQLETRRKQVETLNREIAEIIRQATARSKKAEGRSGGKKSGSGGKAVSTEADAKLSGAFAANKGRLPWPVDGTVIESFGQHYHPVFTKVKLPFNNGVTVATRPGAQVRAVFDGTVERIMVAPGYNQCVLVRHGDYFTFYCKLRGITVKAGDKVTTGTVLGTVDTIGGENQCHFQLWSGREPQDPEKWLK